MTEAIQSVLSEGVKPKRIADNMKYWLTPPDLYAKLNAEFNFNFDPCPCPKPPEYNGLTVEWGSSSYVNPPFRSKDGSPTAFVRKAIEENRKGKQVVLVLPAQSYVNLLLEAGAELRSLGRVRWISAVDGSECKSPSPITMFVLRSSVDRGSD